RLEAPAAELVRRVVQARLRPALEELPNFADLPYLFPFNDEQVLRIARTEPTLRDMLQQFRHLFDHVVYGESATAAAEVTPRLPDSRRLPADELPPVIKSVTIVETPADQTTGNTTVTEHPVAPSPRDRVAAESMAVPNLPELWEQELNAALRKL